MAVKDILVQLDGSERAEQRLDLAIGLAWGMGARLIGLFAQSETDAPSVVARRPSAYLQAAADQAEAAFHRKVVTAGLSAKWWCLTHGESSHVISETVFCSRYADLVVLGQWQAETAKVPEELIEQVVLHSGRPVLIIPEAGPIPRLGERISVAWNASREASRALHDAMPFLKGAAEVNVLSIRESVAAGQSRPEGEPKVDIVDHLLRHGIKARSERLTCDEIGVMDALLSRAFDLGSDLLVMGSHSGLGLNFLRKSGTRFMLRHQTLPMLMSN